MQQQPCPDQSKETSQQASCCAFLSGCGYKLDPHSGLMITNALTDNQATEPTCELLSQSGLRAT